MCSSGIILKDGVGVVHEEGRGNVKVQDCCLNNCKQCDDYNLLPKGKVCTKDFISLRRTIKRY